MAKTANDEEARTSERDLVSARPTLPDLPYPERNVFLMIRFRSSDAHELLTSTIQATLERYGLNLVRAGMSDFRETLW